MLVTISRWQTGQWNPARARPVSGGGKASRICGLRGGGNAAEVAVFEPVAVAFEGDDVGVVDQPVDHGGGDHVAAEHLAPAAERLVAGDDQTGPLVTGRDQLEEQVGGLGFEGDVADL